MHIKLGEFTFSSEFESGNLAKVLPVNLQDAAGTTPASSTAAKAIPAKAGKCSNFTEDSSSVHYEFNLWTSPDCAGTPFENNNRTWFYFSISGGAKGQRARLVIMNLNKQYKLFSQGMLPVVQYQHENRVKTKWERIKEKCFYKSEEGSTIISWIHNVTSERNTTYYAFTFPYSYSDLDAHLSKCVAMSMRLPNIYCHRELLVKSLDGYRVDLLTISSENGLLSEREDPIPGLFLQSDVPRACRFAGERVVFMSARVHPGETSSSFVMSGFLNFIISEDPRAARLRDIFVFKLIPMLNPDGVVRGHYRTDQRGVNLNRVYISPKPETHPTIYGARQIILYHHYKMSIQMLLDNEKSSAETSSSTADVRLPLIDEDTCDSFGDAASKSVGVVTTTSSNQKAAEVDELSASCWDISSNISSDNYPPTGPAVLSLAASEMHDDCSNLSFASETETGVTNMFRSLSPSKFDSEPQPFSFRPKKQDNSFSSCNRAAEVENQPFLTVDPSSQAYSMPISSSATPNYYSRQTNPLNRLPPKYTTGSPKYKKYSRIGTRKNQGDVAPSLLGIKSDYKHSICGESKSEEDSESGLFLYVDLHGHASKRGIFIYGNWFEDADMMVENMLFPKLLSLNCPNFDFTACNFSERNMYIKDKRDGMSKEGSGRVAVMRATGILRSYTLECNYNTGRICNVVPPSSLSIKKATSFPSSPPKYTPSIFEDCGCQLGVSLLDVLGSNEWSRIPFSQFSSLNGIRSNLHCLLASSGSSARSQSVPCQNTLLGRSPAELFNEQIEPSTSMDHSSPQVKTTPKMGRMRTRARRNSWAFSIDAENREPSAQRQSPGKKGSSPRVLTTRLTKQNVARALTFAENDKFALKPALVTTTVALTPSLNVRMSVGDAQPTKVVKKLDKPKKQRRKTNSGGSKKLKIGSGSSCETSPIGFSLPGIDSSTQLSPRSPLASVCEPQPSQSTTPGLMVNLVQPKSPVGLMSSHPTKSPLRIAKLHKRSKKVESTFPVVSSSASWPLKEASDVSKPKVKRRKKVRSRKSL